METQKLFLQEKIKNLGSAIFFNQSDAVLKLPSSIVRIIHVDEYDYVWFYMQKPPQQLNEFEKEFPVKLDFFRKGISYSLQVLGKACMVTDPEEITTIATCVEEMNNAIQYYDLSKMVLIKVKMTRADYFDNISGHKSSWLQNALSTLQSWIFPHSGSYGPTTYYLGMSEVS